MAEAEILTKLEEYEKSHKELLRKFNEANFAIDLKLETSLSNAMKDIIAQKDYFKVTQINISNLARRLSVLEEKTESNKESEMKLKIIRGLFEKDDEDERY